MYCWIFYLDCNIKLWFPYLTTAVDLGFELSIEIFHIPSKGVSLRSYGKIQIRILEFKQIYVSLL